MDRDDRPFIDYLITEFDEGRMNMQTVIAKAILRGENKQWEDPNETQPKVGETVLLEVQDRNKPKKTVCTGWYGGKGHWYRYLPLGGDVPAYPLHWMLMPEPVREEDELRTNRHKLNSPPCAMSATRLHVTTVSTTRNTASDITCV